jgi:hypothetical protein
MKSSHWCIRGKIKLTLTKNSKGKKKATNTRIIKNTEKQERESKRPQVARNQKNELK